MTLEIIIPLRNPTDVLGKTVASLAAQSDLQFSVLIGDNFSTSGHEHIAQALSKLEAASIPARKIQPPCELERIEHWNWLHHQSSADWLKPMLAGDGLDSVYIEKLRAAVTAQPTARSLVAGHEWCSGGRSGLAKDASPAGKFHSPEEARSFVLRHGPRFISPGMMAYDRNAFVAVGGYCASFSRLAPDLLAMTLAGTYGVMTLEKDLCECPADGNAGGRGELTTACFLLAYHAWTDNFLFNRSRFAWMWLRTLARRWFETPA
jgi:hypothetical protein